LREANAILKQFWHEEKTGVEISIEDKMEFDQEVEQMKVEQI
jgi:hypothetical protein